ncbi:MAG TPA: ABC transporter ATP-binding protein [Methylibium sp.]|uniref:ABC transporter ATP-binding protein n=1 Tax=Methylibium sp. TaxID=2067992 RepID=UPI002DBD9044|nr:ABC transporter ATP-binding protein [Methylibium sp.]HEU4460527.1 ABC transporter ATP-binding protein [Methylibium sp.]
MNDSRTTLAATPLLALSGLHRTYLVGGECVHALAGVSLDVMAGERVAVLGPSGSGKSTLLHVLGLLDRPTQGLYGFDGQDVGALGNRARAQLRNRKIGFIFQHFHLLPNLTALENVALPMHYAQLPLDQIEHRARRALDDVGLADRHAHRPAQLSGGERQRVAIARAIVRTPRLLLADEPTGALDTGNGQRILSLIEELNLAHGITVVMITHDAAVAARFPRCVQMRDGRIQADRRPDAAATA